MASPICLILFTHWARRAASRAAWTAGSRSAISTAMIAMTTRSSMRLKPRRRIGLSLTALPRWKREGWDEEARTQDGGARRPRLGGARPRRGRGRIPGYLGAGAAFGAALPPDCAWNDDLDD